jgi:nitrogen fixation NifU-like protein
MLEDLYQQVILDSSRSLRHRGELSKSEHACHELVHNPLCGDTVDLWFEIEDGVVREVKFSGQGCTISQASASLMAEVIEGRTLADAISCIDDFQSLLSGQADESTRQRLGSLVALEGVKKFPVRMRCAMLAFEALRRIGAKTLS